MKSLLRVDAPMSDGLYEVFIDPNGDNPTRQVRFSFLTG